MTDPISNPSPSGAATPAPGSPPRQEQKQAVVLVHGMGEQVPMETLRGFVETMWVRDDNIAARRPSDPPDDGNPVWWKPDFRTGSPELSRITTRGAKPGNVRTDFYEFYWADLTDANTLIQLKDWFMSLLLRRPSQVPPDVFFVWVLLWGLTLTFGGLLLWRAAAAADILCKMPPLANWTLVGGLAIYSLAIGFVLAYFGDVARYVRAKPPNIAARRAIRERGLALLRTLEESNYARIVLVSHSLGTIIAYDVLRTLWAEREEARKMRERDELHAAFERLEKVASGLPAVPSAKDLETYRAIQAEVFDAMRHKADAKQRWLISDFITVGSPLTHAQFLMARDVPALEKAIKERRYPTSPPQFDEGRFLYRPDPGGSPHIWSAHHAAPFAAVRWTNIYDPADRILFLRGDVISGSVQPNFGRAILEHSIKIRRKPGWLPRRLFTHTEYWSETGGGDPQLTALRAALDLSRP